MIETPEQVDAPAEPERWLWTCDDYDRATELGFFDGRERVELLEGDLILMSAQRSQHATSVTLCLDAFKSLQLPGVSVRVQLPLRVAPRSEPEPDVAVVAGSARDYANKHPDTALLVLEVSDTTLRLDRTRKAAIYARAGVPEYWVVNLVDSELEIYREPAERPAPAGGFGYRLMTRHFPSETVASLLAPDLPIAVADLLP